MGGAAASDGPRRPPELRLAAAKALGPDVLLTRDPGYVLEATSEQTDLGRFEKLVGEARGAEDAAARAPICFARPSRSGGESRSQTSPTSPSPRSRSARLEELRAAARADLVDAELELGRHAELVPELEATIASAPSTSGRAASSCSPSTAPAARRRARGLPRGAAECSSRSSGSSRAHRYASSSRRSSSRTIARLSARRPPQPLRRAPKDGHCPFRRPR